MTARPQDVALLPLPWCLTNLRADDQRLVFDYTRACVEANVTAALASAQAREEELRAEVERLTGVVRGMANEIADTRHRAERLEEALRAARQKVYMGELPHGWTIDRIDAALSTNAATQTGGTT